MIICVAWGLVMMVKMTMIALIVPISCLPSIILVPNLLTGHPVAAKSWMSC